MFYQLLYFSLFLYIYNLKQIQQINADPECPNIDTVILYKKRNDQQKSFRLVQYNVEWLFLDYYASMNCPGSGCTWVNESEAQIHMSYVSNIVNILNPDLMNLCEVEGCDELSILSDSLTTPMNYYLKKGTDTATGQNVGLMTKYTPLTDLKRTEEKVHYPLVDSLCGYTGTGGTVGISKHYITTYYWYGKSVVLIGLHLLAYPTDHTRCAEREAQAQVAQNVIMEYINLDYEVVVMGDFNDFDAEVIDANGNKPLSHALDIIKGLMGTYAGKYELENAAIKMEQSERWTDWWDQNGNCVSSPNEFSMIDHVLMTPFLINKIQKVSVYHGYEEFCGKYNSDHYPVVIDMDYPY